MEKTPSYWVTRSAPRRVYAMNPSVKLLAVVRDPVTRAISDYTQSARYLFTTTILRELVSRIVFTLMLTSIQLLNHWGVYIQGIKILL